MTKPVEPLACKCGKILVWPTWPSFIAPDECPGTCAKIDRAEAIAKWNKRSNKS